MKDESEVSRGYFLKRAAALTAVAALPRGTAPAGAPVILSTSKPNEVRQLRHKRNGDRRLYAAQVPHHHCSGTLHRHLRYLSSQSKKGVETIGGDPETYLFSPFFTCRPNSFRFEKVASGPGWMRRSLCGICMSTSGLSLSSRAVA
jgi:hypothetical protein